MNASPLCQPQSLSTAHARRPARWLLGACVAVGSSLLPLGLSAQTERGLMLPEATSPVHWSHWAPRVGVVVSEAGAGWREDGRALSSSAGLKVQSMHVLTDYHLGSGFKATVGLVRGATNLPWWQPNETAMHASGTGLRIQRMDIWGNETWPTYVGTTPNRTVPYIGAAYSGQLTEATGANAWRFQADLGLISLDANNVGRLGRVLTGQQGLDELVRELRLRPVVKFTLNYKF